MPDNTLNVVTSSGETPSPHGFMENRKKEVEILVETLSVYSEKFDEKNAFEELCRYLCAYGELMYAPVSIAIYNACNGLGYEDLTGSMITNLEKLARYIEKYEFDDSNIPEKAEVENAVMKLWDHVNLASQQYVNLKQTDEEYKKKFDKNFETSFNESFEEYKENITRDMNSQLLTMVSIFTALAFLVFGSISSLDNIFAVSGIPVLKLMLTGIVWGLCVLNLVFVFLYCVSKMTNLKIMTSEGEGASLFKRYPLVFWVNFLLLSLLLICAWCYFLQINGTLLWQSLFSEGTKAPLLIGSVCIAGIILVTGLVLSRLTKLKRRENNG